MHAEGGANRRRNRLLRQGGPLSCTVDTILLPMSQHPALTSDTARRLAEYLEQLRDTPPDQRSSDTSRTFEAGSADVHVELTDAETLGVFVVLHSTTVDPSDGPLVETSDEAERLGADIAALLSDVFDWTADRTEFLHAQTRTQRYAGTWYGIEHDLATGERTAPV